MQQQAAQQRVDSLLLGDDVAARTHWKLLLSALPPERAPSQLVLPMVLLLAQVHTHLDFVGLHLE